MPLIDIQVMAGVFDDAEKVQMIEKLTAAFAEVAGQRMAEATSVRVHEVKSGSWGYGGRAMSLEDALAIKAGH